MSLEDIVVAPQQLVPVATHAAKGEDRVAQAIIDSEPCHVCLVPLGGSQKADVTAALGPRQVSHKACYNAAHCLKRMTSKLSDSLDEGGKNRLRQLKEQDLEKWRGMCTALVADAQSARTTAQRQKVRSWVEELVSTTKVARKTGVILLSKRQYVAWFGLREGLPSAEALRMWEEDVADPQVYKERDADEIFVAVRKPTEVYYEESMEKRRRVEQRTDGLEEDP